MIREFVKKSPLLRRLSRIYSFTHNQPAWARLLARERASWNAALKKAEEGPEVLIATSTGAQLAGTTLESLIAVALTLRGVNVHALLCDTFLPACLLCSTEWYPNQKNFSKFGPSRDLCKYCFPAAYRMYKGLGITVHRYSEFLSRLELKEAERISSTIPYEKIADFTLENIAVGEHALAGALRFYARGDLENEPYAEAVLRRYFKSALETTYVMQNLLKNSRFESSLFHHGIYVPQGLIGEVCRQKGIRVVNWNPAYRKKCFIFSHNDSYHHTMMSEPVESWVGLPWNNTMENELTEYLQSRWKGTRDWIWFHEKPKFELDSIASELGIDFSKPSIGMLTSVMWDAVLHYPSNAFKDMKEWMIRTIDYFIKRPESQLIIRVHPAEIRGTLPSRQLMCDEIKKMYPQLPKNIIVIPPESRVSTYAIMLECDAIIIYNTKMGIELAPSGIPIIVAGEAWVRNKGFAIDINSPQEYFKTLDGLPIKKQMIPEQILKAKKYAFHFFFRRMIPVECLEQTRGIPPYKISLSTLGDLMPGRSEGLDVICNGILNGSEFIYPAEYHMRGKE